MRGAHPACVLSAAFVLQEVVSVADGEQVWRPLSSANISELLSTLLAQPAGRMQGHVQYHHARTDDVA